MSIGLYRIKDVNGLCSQVSNYAIFGHSISTTLPWKLEVYRDNILLMENYSGVKEKHILCIQQ